ncbi:MAG: metallophosphoesterase [Candidatus Lokiarchaeota archaeon]|nr:metallophosphoesterase [Candidatus Lokiarchaeota archaeon]
MKIALAADLHLGIRQFNSKQRWQDYLDAYTKLTSKVKELKLDAFVIAGDIFDKSRPHPGVVRKFLRETSKVECPVMLIRGNHDSPQILFEKYGGDILHLINDVSKISYLNKKNPTLKINDVNFIGVGYESYNIPKQIEEQVKDSIDDSFVNVGIFHQLLDFPGVPEDRADVSRNFLKSLGLNLILLGHFHVPYSEECMFNPGSPEYWSFDQGECIKFDLDTEEIIIKPAKRTGFFVIDTNTCQGDFVDIKPARPMFNIIYETENFSEVLHMSKIRNHLEKYNIQDALIKTVIKGLSKTGRTSVKSLTLKKPLIHTPTSMLKTVKSKSSKKEIFKDFREYLIHNGLDESVSKSIVLWIEKNKEKISSMTEKEVLENIRKIIRSQKTQNEEI